MNGSDAKSQPHLRCFTFVDLAAPPASDAMFCDIDDSNQGSGGAYDQRNCLSSTLRVQRCTRYLWSRSGCCVLQPAHAPTYVSARCSLFNAVWFTISTPSQKPPIELKTGIPSLHSISKHTVKSDLAHLHFSIDEAQRASCSVRTRR